MAHSRRFDGRRPPTRDLDHEFTDPVVFRGAAKVEHRRPRHGSRLTFDQDVALISFARMQWRTPVWILREEVEVVTKIRGLEVFFVSEWDIFAGVAFRSARADEILEAFATAGWPVDGAGRPDA